MSIRRKGICVSCGDEPADDIAIRHGAGTYGLRLRNLSMRSRAVVEDYRRESVRARCSLPRLGLVCGAVCGWVASDVLLQTDQR